ncbi:hypothetical protein U9R90_21705 [Streptomyces sp. E11-3]|uniref:hypothetical protein n=1 Tax=Streptomyces sp. E11-3 TaxID=3110112 RepID=UPI00397FFC08
MEPQGFVQRVDQNRHRPHGIAEFPAALQRRTDQPVEGDPGRHIVQLQLFDDDALDPGAGVGRPHMNG